MASRIDIVGWSLHPQAYNEEGRQILNALPGVIWDRPAHAYTGAPHTMREAVALLTKARLVRFRGELPPDPLLAHMHQRARATDLRDYQAEGASWIVRRCLTDGAALLGDEMGLGKSVQALRAFEALSARAMQDEHRPILIVCPSVVAQHWAAECKRWIPWASVGIVGPDKKATARKPAVDGIPHTDVVIASHDMFRRRFERMCGRPWVGCIGDEAHLWNDGRTKRAQALAVWREDVQARQYRRPHLVLLTGTPISIATADLHSLLELMHPGQWGGFKKFCRRYAGGRDEQIPNTDKFRFVAQGATHLDELHRRLSYVMLRRTKAQVGGLPPMIRAIVPVELPASAQKQLQAAAQSCDSAEGLGRLLAHVAEHKIQAVVDYARDAQRSGARPLIYVTRKKHGEAIAGALGCPFISGDIVASKREAAIGDATTVVCSMYAVTTGINLSQFDTVLFCGLDWQPDVLAQAEARPHRIGQTRDVNVRYFVGLGTVDEKIQHRVIDRLETFACVVGGGGASDGMREALSGGTDDELLAEIVASVKGMT